MEKELSLEIRLDWSEMDLFGHINNVSYFKYMQSARINLWEHSGLSQKFTTDMLGPILASTACQFKKPLEYPGKVIIRSKVEFIKTTSFGIIHHLYDEHGEVAAIGDDVVVVYDFRNKVKAHITDELRALLEKYC